MTFWAAGIGLVVGVMTVITLAFGLRKLIMSFTQDVIVRVLVDVGLISQASNPRDQWPNGSTNLPTFLLAMWKSQEYLQGT
ncbi:hypothetical protein LCGC14_3103140, partial [marine sediment metagenome]